MEEASEIVNFNEKMQQAVDETQALIDSLIKRMGGISLLAFAR